MTTLPDKTRPEFATNNPDAGEQVSTAINTLLSHLRTQWVSPPSLAIATAYFNPGGFGLLASELEQVGAVRLLLGAEPLDVDERSRVRPLGQRARRRGPGPDVQRALEGHTRSLEEDRNLLGFTRDADASARRLVKWLEEHPNVEVRRYEDGFLHGKAFIVETHDTGVLAGSSNFTYAGLARNNELNLGLYQPTPVRQVIDWFNEQWDKAKPYDLAGLYKARWEAHQPWDIFIRMLFENYGADLEEATAGSRLGLTAFQADGVWRAKRILDRRNGVLIADEVGLGKTFLAGELIYEATVERRQKVLIVCPATLRDSTWSGFLRDMNLRADVVSYEELVYNIDSAGKKTSSLQNLDEYAMVVIDEAHAFRNNLTLRAEALHRIVDSTVPKDLVLLTATPVNNSLEDLYNLIMFFARNDYAFADVGIPSLRQYFNQAIATDPDDLTAQQLFDVLDATAVRRTRRFVKNHYRGDKVRINGVEQEISFPTCEVQRVDYDLSAVLPGVFDALATALGADLDDHVVASVGGAGVILADIGQVLTMARYVPSQFRLDGETEHYEAQNAGLLRSALLKRFESSAYAFCRTVEKMLESHDRFLHALDAGYVLSGDNLRDFAAVGMDDAEEFLAELEDDDGTLDAVGYNVPDLREAVEADRALLAMLHERVRHVDHTTDPKIERLINELADIAKHATDEGIGDDDTRNKRKVLVFTYFADTANYIETALKDALISDPRLSDFRDRYALVSGPDKANRTDLIAGFAPLTAGTGEEDDIYDLLVTTDVLAEGVNLQQARHIINYDLPWNPMKLVQRHGRIDRIGSLHTRVFMRCFFPDEDLDRILGLEERLQRKLKQAAAAVGVGTVLPGVDPVERSITETRDMIEQIKREEAAIFEDGGSAALSGEEYRRRLTNAFNNPTTKARVLALPWGAGTALERDHADPGFVFCARVGDHDKPFYRYVPLNEDLTTRVVTTADGDQTPEVIRETLSCLSHADPGDDTTPAVDLSPEMYQAAFDAWAVARDDIHLDWSLRTDPGRLAPPLPKVMRDAIDFIEQHGNHLGDKQDTLTSRLKAPYTNRVQRAIRAALNAAAADTSSKTARDTVDALAAVADEYGLNIPEPPVPLPPAQPDDIYLVCWTAITPTPLMPDTLVKTASELF
ncbi:MULTISPECIES: SNF2-related protein [unclassified Nocardioides]|uniref:SNF2-related protein n=1 Tax=unclassified Nocardioides TaxID=2615069 RepID=UPI003015346F